MPEIGDTLAGLVRPIASSGAQTLATNGLLRPGRCGVFLFFTSTCPWCTKLAPSWSDQLEVVTERASADVVWVAALPSDTGAANFVARFRLRKPAYGVVSLAELSRLGVRAVPFGLLTNESGEVLGYGQTRADFSELMTAVSCPA